MALDGMCVILLTRTLASSVIQMFLSLIRKGMWIVKLYIIINAQWSAKPNLNTVIKFLTGYVS